MIKFTSKYRDLFWSLPIMYILGNLFAPLSYVLFLFLSIVWYRKRKHDHLIISLLLILILGDSREFSLFFVKNLRAVMISFLALVTIWELIKKRYTIQPIFLLCIPFFISAAFSNFRSPAIAFCYSKWLSYLFLFFVVFHYLQFHIKRSGEKLAMDIIHLASWVFLIGLIFILLKPSTAFLLGRYRGLLGNPNGMGLYCFFAFSYGMAIWHIYPHRRKIIGQLFVLLFISVLLCGSRNSLASILLFLLIYKLYRGKPIRRILFWTAIVPIVVLFFQLVSIEDLVVLMGLGDYLRVESIMTGTGRYLAWTIGWSYIQEYLWLGGGFAYEELMFIELREFLITTEHQGGLHNSYLTLIMNTGIVGFSLLLGFLVLVISRIKPAFLAIPFMVTALISANFESWLAASLNAFTIHFFLIIIVLSNYYTLKQKYK